MASSHSSDEFLTCGDSSDSESISGSSSNEEVQETEEIHSYDDSVEPVPTEEEAAQYMEQLELEEEEERTLLSRFSGEEDVSNWYVDVLFAVHMDVSHRRALSHLCCLRIINNFTILHRVNEEESYLDFSSAFAFLCALHV